ncbi:hypothetical protein D3C86_1842590 [compost metagenome]
MACTVSISLTPNIGAGDTMIAEGWSSKACWNSLRASQSSRPDGRFRLLSLRQRRVRVSSTTMAGVVGSTYCQSWKRRSSSINLSWVALSQCSPSAGAIAKALARGPENTSGLLPQPWQSM